jgi:hypothetical protein
MIELLDGHDLKASKADREQSSFIFTSNKRMHQKQLLETIVLKQTEETITSW